MHAGGAVGGRRPPADACVGFLADRRRRARPLPEPRRASCLYVDEPRRGLDLGDQLPHRQGGREVADPRRRQPGHGRRLRRRQACSGSPAATTPSSTRSRPRERDGCSRRSRSGRARTASASGRSPAATRSATPASSASGMASDDGSQPSDPPAVLVVAAAAAAAVAATRAAWIASPAADGPRCARAVAARGRRRAGVALDEVSPLLREAVVATEDERFYRHHGVDLIGVARALPYDLVHLSFAQGASTITEQVAKLLYLRRGRPLALAQARGRGARAEARGPVHEGADPRRLPEQRVLRRGRDGVRAASERYFGVAPARLDDGAGEPARRAHAGAVCVRPVPPSRRSPARGRSPCCARSSAPATSPRPRRRARSPGRSASATGARFRPSAASTSRPGRRSSGGSSRSAPPSRCRRRRARGAPAAALPRRPRPARAPARRARARRDRDRRGDAFVAGTA